MEHGVGVEANSGCKRDCTEPHMTSCLNACFKSMQDFLRVKMYSDLGRLVCLCLSIAKLQPNFSISKVDLDGYPALSYNYMCFFDDLGRATP